MLALLLPWQPWRHREQLAAQSDAEFSFDDTCVLIPARNEVRTLPHTLRALRAQGSGLHILVVDDSSDDGTPEVVAEFAGVDLVCAPPLPARWSGKVWAQAVGLEHITQPKVLLLDADIVLAPGMLAALHNKLEHERLDMVSIMARLPVISAVEKLLTPAFIYFFKWLYPFALSNRANTSIAAAAGGCILLRRSLLEQSGGFHALRHALIDDCELAKRLKAVGARLWTGQSDGVVSQRGYPTLAAFWNMVARTAFTQLNYRVSALLLATVSLLWLFLMPVVAVFVPSAWFAGVCALTLMVVSYMPTVRIYRLSPAWALSLPVAAVLYLLMTWTSAWRHVRGETAHWRGRRYATSESGLR